MTIAELRKIYPHESFYFYDKNGIEISGAPFYHDDIEGYRAREANGVTYVSVYMPARDKE